MPRDWHQEQRIWLLQRQCALSPRQLVLAYGVLCVFSFTVATALVVMGVWQILCFTALEMTAVACAFLYQTRHASDQQRIVLTAECLMVETLIAGCPVRIRLDPLLTRVEEPPHGRGTIVLKAGRQRILIGGMVSEQRRRQCAQELREALNAPPKNF